MSADALRGPKLSVFTKPWRVPIPALARWIQQLGFDGVELPVRPGYAVNPDNAAQSLPEAANILADHGLQIYSVAAPMTDAVIAACGAAGVPMLRIMAPIGNENYFEAEARIRREIDVVVGEARRQNVVIGVQNHCGRYVSHALGLHRLLEPYATNEVCAVWDAAHNALNGEDLDIALDIIWARLGMVNLKNALWEAVETPEDPVAKWRPRWTIGRAGLASWPRVAADLIQRSYNGVVCLTAEYSDEEDVDQLIGEDIAFARSLWGQPAGVSPDSRLQ
jgi:sugar phosphate isomerase/epimerase